MKKITSVTQHTTGEGQRLSYTYSVIDDSTGAVITTNARDSVVVLDIPANKETLAAIGTINDFVSERLGA